MEQMRAGILSICMLSTAIGICSLLRPEQTLGRQLRFLLSMLLLIGLAVPLLQLRLPASAFSGEAFLQQQEEHREAFEERLLLETQKQTETALRERLSAEGITCTMLSVTLHRAEDGSIYCSEVQLSCNAPERAAALLRTLLGEEVSICAGEMVS